MNPAEPNHEYESITGLAARVRAGSLSPVALVEHSLERMAALDPRLHAFLYVSRERALGEARAAEQALSRGRPAGPLHGIPYAAKDLFDVRGLPTTAGTRFQADRVAQDDGAVVKRLAAAGMSLVGKTHTVQLAFGTLGLNGDQGTPHNPWHRVPHSPGGSSSGSAVAVASGMVPMALGTDTGGSVRIPAAFCGIVGLKTTVGRVSRAGVYPLSFSLDSVGPLTRTVEDAATVLAALQGEDPNDRATLDVAPLDVESSLGAGVRGMRIGIGETLFFEDCDPEIEAAVRAAAATLGSLGARVESLEIPEAAKVWSLEKRALYVAAEACHVNRDLLDRHAEELDAFVVRRMLPGRTLLATEYFELKRRFGALRDGLWTTLRDFDAFVVPTTPIPPPTIADVSASLEAYAKKNGLIHRNCGFGNFLGLCAVSVPCGFTRDGLPIGLQIYARPFQEDVVLRVARAYERATDWHSKRPDLSWAGAAAST